MHIRQLVLLPVLVGTAAPVLGQQPESWSSPVTSDSTLQALVAEALERNPTVAQRQAAVRAAALRIRPAGTLPDPILNVGVMNLPLPSLAFRQSDFTEVDVELMQEILWPGALGARADGARAAAGEVRGEAAVVRRDVAAAMAAAYYRLSYAATALEILSRQRELLQAAVRLSTTRYATGSAPQSDPLQARLARDRLRSEEAALQGEYAVALAQVNALRARAAGTPAPLRRLDAQSLSAVVRALPPLDSLVVRAAETHPRIAARQAAVERAARTIDVERLGARPDFTLGVRYGHRPQLEFGFDPPDFFSAFVSVRVPLWAARKQNRLADAARADSVAAEAGYREAELEVGRAVAETAALVEAARRRLGLLVDGVLPSARATVESVLRSYQVGRTEFLTLLAVEDARYRAELEAATVAAEYRTQLFVLRELTREESEQ